MYIYFTYFIVYGIRVQQSLNIYKLHWLIIYIRNNNMFSIFSSNGVKKMCRSINDHN